ncbi:LLM class F420-dependent oxidoreductase [Sphaerisporangium krabiense]|uniref:G6PDH family F420-dependent oxidoreductase n=1 Tax=Sphaerisporangium krabiense TaxID=763782 RepID=A0A7W8YZ43_9ACTN|nr:LLM class F420-dependent oxidoreductase [Sphaerisporangium krabiense]MBB5624498.1 G6PDH family F420-dependent oxidoreductase [Sphaerisporangium krabiense]GII61546.1 LLM class F420-dependent oxidoreductase [Sphaerisporangium krabiense]
MTTFGYFLSSEEHGPRELVRQARLAERAGFEALWISDHYHPWVDEQGQSPFVWTVIGALAEATSLPITTAVTCPLVRVHPAVIAQAAATSAVITEGRFRLGVGTGEALNEHITDSRWPPAAERLEMLEEAIGLMRELWSGELVTHRGRHYSVDTARVYTRPDTPPPVYVSGFGPKAVDLAGRLGDGYILTGPSAELIEKFHEAGGRGKPVQGGLKVCYDEDAGRARKTVHRLWPNQGITGEASQLLPLPRHFEQLAELVTEEQATAASPCGPDPEEHAEAIGKYVDAGFDEVYVNQIGPNQEAFFDFYAREVLPRLR